MEQLFLTAMYMEYSRMRPEEEVGASHVMCTESFACGEKKTRGNVKARAALLIAFLSRTIYHLCNFDSRGCSGETRLAGLELTDRAEVSLTKAIDACDSEPVGLTWSQFLLLPALVVPRPRKLPLEESKGPSEDVSGWEND